MFIPRIVICRGRLDSVKKNIHNEIMNYVMQFKFSKSPFQCVWDYKGNRMNFWYHFIFLILLTFIRKYMNSKLNSKGKRSGIIKNNCSVLNKQSHGVRVKCQWTKYYLNQENVNKIIALFSSFCPIFINIGN